jgi:hypothetical protein
MLPFLIFVPFIIQAIAILLDEGLYHLKRDLPLWERIGHPIDTFSMIACFLFILLIPYDPRFIKFYIALGVVSCLLVTKDEFVHKHYCPAGEHWLHAILFINHSLLITALGFIWPKLSREEMVNWVPDIKFLLPFLWAQVAFASLFFLYQIVYWNFIRAKNQ